MFPPPATPEEISSARLVIQRFLDEAVAENPAVAGVEIVDDRQWFVRLLGEEKGTFSLLLTLDQRTVRYESYLLPDPLENREATFEYLLRHTYTSYGLAASIGPEDGVFLVGQLDIRHIDDDELDRVLGSIYEATERLFRPAMRLAFASQFSG